MTKIEQCDVLCAFFKQRMNYPKNGQYSGLCEAKGDVVIFTEEISRYDRYGTASRFPCIAPDAKKIAEDVVTLLDPFGWMGPKD